MTKAKIIVLILAAMEILFVLFILPSAGYWVFSISRKDKQSLKSSFTVRSYPLVTSKFNHLLTAKSALVIDQESGVVLFSKNENQQLFPASLTKIMTALVSLDSFSLDEVVTVREPYLVGRNISLEKGERIKVKNLIYALLIHSANDSAFVLADHFPGGKEKFVEAMNRKAKEFGLSGTNFVNFDGEDDLNHYSTAYDLAQITRLTLKNEIFGKTILIREMTISDESNKIVHKLETTNELLGKMPDIMGVKTGWTEQAGECFVGYFSVDGRGLITVALGSKDRFGETKLLIDWVKRSVRYEDYSAIHSGVTAGK